MLSATGLFTTARTLVGVPGATWPSVATGSRTAPFAGDEQAASVVLEGRLGLSPPCPSPPCAARPPAPEVTCPTADAMTWPDYGTRAGAKSLLGCDRSPRHPVCRPPHERAFYDTVFWLPLEEAASWTSGIP